MVLTGLLGVLVGTWQLRRCNRFILVSHDELRLFDSNHREETFPMSRIGGAKWSRISGTVTVMARDGSELLWIPYKWLGSHRRSQLVASLTRQHVTSGSSSEEPS